MLVHLAESEKALRLAADMSKTYYEKKLIVTYSGGKDSDVLVHLAESFLQPDEWEVVNSNTSVDAPQTVKHIMEVFKRLNKKGIETKRHIPMGKDGKQLNMTKLIVLNRMPPTRIGRYCCRHLKETSNPNRFCAMGVREEESNNRRGRDIFATRGIGGGGESRLDRASFFRLTV